MKMLDSLSMIVAGITVGLSRASAQSTYTLTDLGSLPGYGQSAAYALNSSGKVVGSAFDKNITKTRAFLFADGRLTDLGTLPGGVGSSARSINAYGQIVGSSTNAQTGDRAFLYTDGVMTDLGAFFFSNSGATGLNSRGDVVGWSYELPPVLRDSFVPELVPHPFLFSNGNATDLVGRGGPAGIAAAINDAGQIVGLVYLATGGLHACVYANGQREDIGTLGGGGSAANAINASGQIVGWSNAGVQGGPAHAFLYSESKMTDLGTLPPHDASEAMGINASGQIVGVSRNWRGGTGFDNPGRGFLISGDRMIDLNTRLVDARGWVLISATAINDAGAIAGVGMNAAGDVHGILLSPIPDPLSVAITAEPVSENVVAGSNVTFSAAANGVGVSFQWRKNGAPIAGATTRTLTLNTVGAANMGFYTAVASSGGTSVESKAAILTVTGPPGAPLAPSRLANISTRGMVQAGGALTPGVVLRGVGTKQLVVRAVGPALFGFGLAGVLADPQLELIRVGTTTPLLTNDDWAANQNVGALTAACATVGAFTLAADSKDAAVIATLDTAATGTNYSVRITADSAMAAGLVLAEVYDADPAGAAVQIANLSTLAVAGAGSQTLVSGFVIDGVAAKRLLIRAIGPGLRPFGVTGVVADPKLQLFAGSQLVAENDDWGGTAALASAFATAGAFFLSSASKDAALLITLPPGSYTAQVSGAAASGLVLLEVYESP